jgi:hypothetical protein
MSHRSRRMRWEGHVARRERCEMHTIFWWVNLKGRYYLEDLGIDGNIILEWILRKLGVRVWNVFTWLRIGTNGGLL